MKGILILSLMGLASLAFGAVNRPFTQNNTSGLTQNNTSGLTQNMTTSTDTQTNTGIRGSLMKPLTPLPSISSMPSSQPAGLPAGAVSTREPQPSAQKNTTAPANGQPQP
jgi:hypothetical protein